VLGGPVRVGGCVEQVADLLAVAPAHPSNGDQPRRRPSGDSHYKLLTGLDAPHQLGRSLAHLSKTDVIVHDPNVAQVDRTDWERREHDPHRNQRYRVRKSFGDKLVLDGIDLNVAEGTIFSLLGPNGAGKTTVVNILSTLIPADGGSGMVVGRTGRSV